MKGLTILALSAFATPSVWAKPVDGAEKFLVETAPGKTQWVTEAQKFELKAQGIDFFDITDEPESDFHITEQAVAAFPNRLRYIQEAKPLAGKLSKDNMKKNLEKFSSFNNRYYRSQTGVDSANWMFEQVTALLKSSGAAQRGATVKKFTHSFLQPSIIATIPGKSANTIVVGAHQDSVNSRSPTNGRAPGADDNGSGSVTILEALGALLSSPNIAQGQADNTIEFHWYAGEEAGLLGSQDVFRKYKADNKPVKAMLNQDMTGYTRRRENDGLPEAMGLVTDNVNAELTTFTRLVIGGYTDITFVNTSCGYACSDHASATRNGYPSAFVYEADLDHDNPTIHTANDVVANINFNHAEQHGKMIIGWVYELAFTTL